MMSDADNIFYNRLRQAGLKSLGTTQSNNFLFKITAGKNDVIVSIVDSMGMPMVDNLRGSGAEARAATQICTSVSSRDMWREKSEDETVLSASLARNPALVEMLSFCTNLVDSKLRPIKVDKGFHRLTLHIEPDENGLLSPSFRVTAGENTLLNPVMMSADFGLSDDYMFQVDSIGDNYNSLKVFAEPFPADMLETYLAVFLTFFRNVDISYEGYTVRRIPAEVQCVPTVAFDGIERDRTLGLRLLESAPDRPVSPVNLTVDVEVTDDRRIVIRPLKRLDMEACGEKFMDLIAESTVGKRARKNVYFDGSRFLLPEDIASTFLLNALPRLLLEYRVEGLERLKDFKVTPLKPHLNVRFNTGIDYLDASADVSFDDGTTMTLEDLLKQFRQNKYVSMPDGSRGVLDPDFIKHVSSIFSSNRAQKDGNYRLSFFDLPDLEHLLGNAADEEPALKKPMEFYRGFNALKNEKLDLPDVSATLRPYQVDGVKWLKYLYDNNVGGCLADDMGLGKTLQAISLLTMANHEQPSLLVMPRSLLFNWQNELKKFAPGLDYYIYYGQNRDYDEAVKHRLILTTYALVRNDIDRFAETEFDTVLLDESQNIKNLTAQLTLAVFRLKGRHRFALSGTPVENNLTELYSLFHFLNPMMMGTLDNFNAKYARPIQNDGNREAAASLRRRIYPFMLRRLKRDVLADLPDRVDQTVYVDMEPEHKRFYENKRLEYLRRINDSIAQHGIQKARFIMLQAMSELRRIASVPESLSEGKIPSPKIDYLAENIASAVDNGHKVVVFFNFIAGIELLGEQLEARKIDYASMTGSTTDRRNIVERFQNSPDCKVLLMTLKTGGVGLNLTAADIVYIAEPWWNNAAQEQAINRLHRIGQKATVFSTQVITKDTIEEKIVQLQQYKAELFDDVITGDESSAKSLTEEDIHFIFS